MGDVKEVSKHGDYYVVTGRASTGRDVSAHIPAPTVENLSRKEATEFFKRSVDRVGEV